MPDIPTYEPWNDLLARSNAALGQRIADLERQLAEARAAAPEPLRRLTTLDLPEGNHHSKLIVPGPLPVPPGTKVAVYLDGQAPPASITRHSQPFVPTRVSREGIYTALSDYAEAHPDWTSWNMAEDLWGAYTVCLLPDTLRVQDVAAVIAEATTGEEDDWEFDVSAAADAVMALLTDTGQEQNHG